MNANEIKSILESDPVTKNIFKGTYAKDEYPIYDLKPSGYIINTGVYGTPGEHWVSILVLSDRIYYFCSLGSNPFKDHIMLNFLKTFNKNKIYVNPYRFQSNYSSICGQFCLLFLYYLSRGMPFRNFINLFDKSINKMYWNEQLVCYLIKQNFRKKIAYCTKNNFFYP